jgi:hypothetical protein
VPFSEESPEQAEFAPDRRITFTTSQRCANHPRRLVSSTSSSIRRISRARAHSHETFAPAPRTRNYSACVASPRPLFRIKSFALPTPKQHLTALPCACRERTTLHAQGTASRISRGNSPALSAR